MKPNFKPDSRLKRAKRMALALLLGMVIAILCMGAPGLVLIESAGTPASVNVDAALYGYITTLHAQMLKGDRPLNPWDADFFYPSPEPLALTESHFLASAFAYPVIKCVADPFVAIVIASVLAFIILLMICFCTGYAASGSLYGAALAAIAIGLMPAFRAEMLRPFFWPLLLLPIFLRLVLQFLDAPTVLRSVYVGLLLGVMPWASSHVTVFALGIVLICAIVYAVNNPRSMLAALKSAPAGVAVATLVGGLPLYKQVHGVWSIDASGTVS
jgi:hypothetical protein